MDVNCRSLSEHLGLVRRPLSDDVKGKETAVL